MTATNKFTISRETRIYEEVDVFLTDEEYENRFEVLKGKLKEGFTDWAEIDEIKTHNWESISLDDYTPLPST